eukprot:TRINITY_DN73997_c0_g1_i1.p1 TRINITY_DN73997_c0_g1~~TRINITY_DN73997_c0_g1_i1.p1  ORF type:complete len:245 (+),score=60.93 TRINITY_DN73997_c0_g1_i1:38-772(+)
MTTLGDPDQAPVLFEQDFAKLEQSLEAGEWEVDGDDLCLLSTGDSEATADDGLPGAVVVTEGGVEALAELAHRIRGDQGAQVTRLALELVCESLHNDSNGTFTVGLAFDDDLEEAALLAVTVRRPRPESKLPREPGDPPEEPEEVKPVSLQINGEVAAESLGDLPVRLQLDVRLQWGSKEERKAVLRHRLVPMQPGAEQHIAEVSTTSCGFYTTDVSFDVAKVLFLRATGTVRIRLLSLQCNGP